MAALAGMSRATFDKAKADEALFKWILSEQQDAQKKYGVDSTPTFVVNNEVQKGHLTFDRLKKLIPGA